MRMEMRQSTHFQASNHHGGNMKKCRCFLVVAALFFLMPWHVSAQTRAGLFKVSLDSTVFAFGVGEVDWEDGPERDYDAPTVGFGLSSAGIGFGYTVIDKLVIGGRLTLGMEGRDEYLGDDWWFIWSVLPFAEYVFLDGLVRPFVMGTLGFEGKSDDFDDNDTWWWGFTFGPGGGIHFFVHDNVSLDLIGMFLFTVGTGEDGRPRDDDFKHWRFRLSVLAGISGWF